MGEFGTDRRTTIDHDVVRRWVERRGGEPAAVAADAPAEAGSLRIRFPDESGGTTPDSRTERAPLDERVERIDWETFFERFEAQELALVYREDAGEADGSDGEDGPALDRSYELADRVFVGEV